MNRTQDLKCRSNSGLAAVLAAHESWKEVDAFAEGVSAFLKLHGGIQQLAQAQLSRPDVGAEKRFALQELGDAAHEVAAALVAWGEANGNLAIAGQMDFTRTAITRGAESKIVARCQNVLANATMQSAALAEYGITPAKLTGLKKKLETFQAAQPKPRYYRSQHSSVTRELHKAFAELDHVLTRCLDKLVVQFKTSDPEFYNEYLSGRRVDQASVRTNDPVEAAALNPAEPIAQAA